MQRRTLLQAGAALGLVAMAPQLFAAGKLKPDARSRLSSWSMCRTAFWTAARSR